MATPTKAHPVKARTPARLGRPKGAPTKAKAAFRDALRTYATGKDCDPHRWLVRLMADTRTTLERQEVDEAGVVHHFYTPTVPLNLKLTAAIELANYLEPKLRSVVVTGDAENPLTVLHAMPQADLDALLARRLAEAGYGPLLLPEGAL
jgi:hypothetical protein